jgi:hypothetical protein
MWSNFSHAGVGGDEVSNQNDLKRKQMSLKNNYVFYANNLS